MQCCELVECFFRSLTQERRVPLQKLLKLFVLPTLQFFTFVQSKLISNLNIRINSAFWIRMLEDSIFHYMHPQLQ